MVQETFNTACCNYMEQHRKPLYKFKYLGFSFTNDGRQDEELDIRIDQAIAIIRTLHYLVDVRQKLLKKSKALNVQNSLCPFLPA